MGKNKIMFESGKEYTLADIFSGENKIVIPDLQRDYCWGDKAWDKDKENHTELVSGFVQNLLTSYNEWGKNKNDVTLGLIYGYEQPMHYIQLCDGQQRITTLFLLLGMLNRKSNYAFQKYLISDYELEKDDKEPYLQYAIRESTLYFLSDLVCKFFRNKDIPADKITEQDWYFKEYNLDASIQSMIAALITIEKKLVDLCDYEAFGKFVLNNLEMIYYDMGDRKRGEETFVIINTTGEPLTATENLKPILLGNLQDGDLQKYSEQWEDREEWFWNNKNDKETSADDALNDFFVWYWQIRLLQEKTGKSRNTLNPQKMFLKKPEANNEDEDNPTIERWESSVSLDTVQKYFVALQKVVELCKQEKIANVLKTIKDEDINLAWLRKTELHSVLPLIAYLEKFPEPKLFYEFVRRIRKNYFDKKRERGNFVDWRHIVQIIECAETDEEEKVFVFNPNARKVDFKKIRNVELNEWYNSDEQNKNFLKNEQKTEVEKWEDHPDLMGDLAPLWNANKGRENSFENITTIYNTFDLLYNCYDEDSSKANPNLSNYVRLYRVLIEESRLTRPQYTSGMQGAWFSWKNQSDNSYFQYLKNNKFLFLFKYNQDEILDHLKDTIKAILKKEDILFDEDKFSATKHLKAWLLIKVLSAEQNKILLPFYDGRGTGNGEGNGLASYDECKKNKLNEDLPFSLGNSICGFAVKRFSRIDYANRDWWTHAECFDTICYNSFSHEDFDNSNKEDNPIPILPEKIAEIDISIQALLNDFYK